MKCVDDFRLRFGNKELVPIVIGGMGVDISATGLALEGARLGGIGHISDAMIHTVSDRRYETSFVSQKAKLYKYNAASSDKSKVLFDLGRLDEATQNHVRGTMSAKRGEGLIGSSLEAKLTFRTASDRDSRYLKELLPQLPMLFIASQVVVEDVLKVDLPVGGTFAQTEIIVAKADGQKCPRCWNYKTDISEDKDHPAVCARCAKAVKGSDMEDQI